MILPKILPDELLAGYRGRIAAFNGLRTPKEVALAIRDPDDTRPGANNQTLAFIDAAATLNGVTAETLLQRHSCLALYRGAGKTREHDHSNERVLSAFRSLAMFNPDKRLRACPKCVATDIHERSFAYWRRSHQVPGRFVCAFHGGALWTTAEPELVPAGPDDVSESSRPFDDVTCHRLANNAFVARTLTILDVIVREGLFIDWESCNPALRQAVNNGLERGSAAKSMLAISGAIEGAFTMEWLTYAMPGASLTSGRTHNFVKNCLYEGTGQTSYASMAVVASLLFPTAEAALTTMDAMSVKSAPVLSDRVQL